MILQFGQSCLALASKFGLSCDSYRAVLDSGSRRAMVPDLLPPPLPLLVLELSLLLEPQPAPMAAAAAMRATTAHLVLTGNCLLVVDFGFTFRRPPAGARTGRGRTGRCLARARRAARRAP